MKKAIHINQARAMLDSGEPVDLRVVLKDGTIALMKDVVSLSYDVYTGMRNIKHLQSNQIRSVRDCLIIGIDDFDVFL